MADEEKPQIIEIEFRVSITAPKACVKEQLTTLIQEFACHLCEQIKGANLTAVGWSQSRRARLSRTHLHPRRRRRRIPVEEPTDAKPN